ncbi:DedA family protein [Massilia soli]|uniref:DedA family protein n=1 Tax=Massilia soli TaxID=2792854 RepID=A0ABS7SVV9_9BURK|nr:DedA family protein [Massilia soli]MBZ2210086.1 DedA family protein [Massilia soli]
MVNFVIDLISRIGYFGIFLLMALENIFPPIPSEVIMPFAGFVVSQGKLNFGLVLLAGAAGSVAGALPWYFAGKWLGTERLQRLAKKHGRWLTVSPEEIEKSVNAFNRHGKKAVLFGRLIPAVRTLISVPAGIVEMNLSTFLAYTTAGSLVWASVLASAGYLLEKNYTTVGKYIDPTAETIVASILVVYVYRVVTHQK